MVKDSSILLARITVKQGEPMSPSIPFIYAKEFKEQYDVWGAFYDIFFNDSVFKCRNLLEIYDKWWAKENVKCNSQFLQHPASASSPRRPDAVFIMMNPGSSKPLEADIVPTKYPERNLTLHIQKTPLVKTKPDPAQYQVMRVMAYKKWNYVRVINLSDLRETKSEEFLKIYQSLPINTRLFSPARSLELEAVLSEASVPIIAAWGLDRRMISLAKTCLEILTSHRVLGVQKRDKDSNLYAYPSPPSQDRKIAWLEDIRKIIK